MSNVSILSLILFVVLFVTNHGFIPNPTIRFGGQAGDGITHTEITQLGFIRSLARFFFETNAMNEYDKDKEYTIDELYQLVNPTWTSKQIQKETHPLKNILDIILIDNVFVDIDHWTKKLSAAHFDSEAFLNGSRRIINIRRIILDDILNKKKNFKQTHGLLGQLLHTLQDFYSHSNWIELGNKDINERIGIYEDIGPIAEKNQSTCQNEGCTRFEIKCNLLQKVIFFNKCPLVYYECKNNIRSDILKKGLLTSGYSVNQHNEDNEPVPKPTNVEKCSHGSVLDTSSHLPAIGGINKDTDTPIYSPHYDLHDKAATMAIAATERFFNDLRKDIGDENFDRFFAIHPTKKNFEYFK